MFRLQVNMGNDPLNGHSGNDQLPTGNQLKLSIFLLSRFPLKKNGKPHEVKELIIIIIIIIIVIIIIIIIIIYLPLCA